MTSSPRLIVLPPSSTSVAAQRLSVRSTGPSKRRSSSTAAGSERGIVPHELELLRMREQVEHRVADQADGRLVAGDDQEHDGAEQLVLAEGVALVSRRDQRADQIVPRLGAPLGEELAGGTPRTRSSARGSAPAPPARARA